MSTAVTTTTPTSVEREAILARATVRVRYTHDEGLWQFAVGNPAILGGACRSLEEAERRAAEAIARALTSGRPHGGDADEDEVLGGFEVDIRLASA